MRHDRIFVGLWKLWRLLPAVVLISITTAQAQDPQVASAGAPAQSLPKSSDYISEAGVSVEELIHRMSANNLELQAARQRLTQAEARLTQASLRANPHLDFEQKSDRLISNQGSREEEMTFNQPLELFGKRSRRIGLARVEIERIRYEVADLERRRTADLAILIGQAISAAAHLYSLERISELNENLRRATLVRVKAGDASRYDFNQIESEAARLESERLSIASQVDSLLLQIKALIGMPLEEPIKLRDEPRVFGGEMPSPDEALKLAAELRPDLKTARLAEEEAEAKIRLAETGGAPDLGVILGFKRDATVDPAPLHSSDWQFKVGVSIVLPAFNRNQGAIREAAAALSEARLTRQNLELMVRRDVMIALKRLGQAQRNVKLHEEQALRLGRGNVQMARLGFEQGELRLADYLTEQRRLTDVERSYAQARAEVFQAKIELERAIGRPQGR
ncbi:MAG TPA: TolC family protein [Blastocatellia bacterium]|nr:TolC family protein [Blastocatellia bacterium]